MREDIEITEPLSLTCSYRRAVYHIRTAGKPVRFSWMTLACQGSDLVLTNVLRGGNLVRCYRAGHHGYPPDLP